jgi:hypothetical protein
VHPGLSDRFGPPLDAAHAAPLFTDTWPQMRDKVTAILRSRGRPADGYLVIGETPAERAWAEAGKTAGFLTGETYFAA